MGFLLRCFQQLFVTGLSTACGVGGGFSTEGGGSVRFSAAAAQLQHHSEDTQLTNLASAWGVLWACDFSHRVSVASSASGEQQSVGTPQTARGWVRPPCEHFKIQSCCCLVSVFEVAAFRTLAQTSLPGVGVVSGLAPVPV